MARRRTGFEATPGGQSPCEPRRRPCLRRAPSHERHEYAQVGYGAYQIDPGTWSYRYDHIGTNRSGPPTTREPKATVLDTMPSYRANAIALNRPSGRYFCKDYDSTQRTTSLLLDQGVISIPRNYSGSRR